VHKEVFEYVESMLRRVDVSGKAVLEAGSYDFNGTVRPMFMARQPAEYIGVDILEGPGVDVVCSAGALVDRFGEHRFDVVVTTEMMEHVQDWRAAVSHMKRVLKPGGVLILTTRSRGEPYHGYPHDYWRYELDDMRTIFDDMELLDLSPDPSRGGVFLTARKPEGFAERDLSDIALYSILTHRRTRRVARPIEWLIIRWIGLIKQSYVWMVKARMFIWQRLLPLPLRRLLKRTLFRERPA